jgi:PAS domain S-box-containing protein
MLLIVFATREQALPTFFVQGDGGTIVRQTALGSAIAMFAAAAVLLWSRRASRASAFGRWYSLALALVSVGLLGVMVQSSVGSAVNWVGRAAQLLSGVYMLIAAAAGQRQSRVLAVSLEASLLETEQRFRSLVELAPDAIIAHQDGRIVYANSAALRLYGAATPEALLGRVVLDFVFPADRQQVHERMQAAVSGQTTPLRVMRLLRLDGEPVAVETTACAIDYQGQPAVQVILRDITDRRRADQALRESEARFRAAIENLPVAFVIYGPDRRIEYVNPTASRAAGLSPEALLGKRLAEVWPEQLLRQLQPSLERAYDKREPQHLEFTAQLLDGTALTSITAFIPLLGEGGEVRQVFGVSQDVSDKANALEALREVDRQKNQFLAALSHELRNPLSPIKSSLAVLELAPHGSDQERRARGVLQRQVDQLSRIVDDLLDVTRINRNKVVLRPERMDVNELVAGVVEDHRSLFDSAGVQLQVRCAAHALHVNADGARLAQAVSNLLQNAAKFTGRGGSAEVATEQCAQTSRALVRVRDTGLGMSAHTVAQLFQPFMQADPSLDRSKGGLGLGLALVKSLLELHGGEVSAHSAGLGTGSEFVLAIPLAGPEEKQQTRAPAQVAPRARRVLVIEDNVDAADSLRDVLELQSHQVAVARTGQEGLEMARAFHPDIVLCDIGLPGMDGFDVARALRADAAFSGVLLVALSGYALPEDLRRATEAGFDRHLAKPPDFDKLERLLAGTATSASQL